MVYTRWILIVFLSFMGFDLAAGINASSIESKIKLIGPRSQFILNDPLLNFSGTLVVPSVAQTSLQGEKIYLDAGRFELGFMRGSLKGSLNPNSLGNIVLSGDMSFVGDKGAQVLGISVSGSNNRLGGWVDVSTPLVLVDANSSLELSIENALNRNIILNGGFLTLKAPLDLVSGVIIKGSGTIDAGGQSLVLRSKNTVFTDQLIWASSVDLFLYEKLMIQGCWTLGQGSPVSMKINGCGRDLDLSLGGTIIVPSGCSLILEDVVLKGIGSLGGAILLKDSTSSVTFVGCTINLLGDLIFSAGSVNFVGRDSTLVLGAASCAFSGTSLLLVDGIVLYYDSLQVPGIIVSSPSNLLQVSEGRVLSVHKKQSDARLVIDDTSIVCSGKLDLTAGSPLFFRGRSSSNLELVGSDLFVNCASLGSDKRLVLISVAAHKKAVIKDTVIHNFDPSSVGLGVGSQLVFGNNTELNLGRAVSLAGALNISGNVLLKGEGNVFNCSSGSVVFVAPNSSLTLQDLVFSGLGGGVGKIVLADATSTVYFKNVTLSLAGNYTQTTGRFYFSGTRSTIVTGTNILSFEGSASCTFDGVNVVYDPLDSPDVRNVRPFVADGVSMIYRKGGSCSVVGVTRVAGSLGLLDSQHDLQRNEFLSSSRKLTYAGFSSSCTVSGQGFVIYLPFAVDGVIEVPSNKRLEFKDVVFRDFNCRHFRIGSNSTIAFGDNVVIQLSEDLVVASNITISGKTILDCAGHRVIFQEGFGFFVEPGGCLELRNGYVLDLHDQGNPILMAAVSSKLILTDMVCALSGDFTLAQGSLEISGETYFSTRQHSFVYSSPGFLTIKPSSSFIFNQESTFRYDSHGGHSRFIFSDKTSSLYLDSATFSVGRAGVDLVNGMLFVNGVSVVCGDTGPTAYGVHFKANSFDTNVLLKATLDLRGLIVND